MRTRARIGFWAMGNRLGKPTWETKEQWGYLQIWLQDKLVNRRCKNIWEVLFMDTRMDNIPYDLHLMVEIIGHDNFLEVCKMYGGDKVYIPVHRKVMLGHRNREMVRLYNGRNLDELRVKYGISKQQVKRILAREGVL